MTIGAAILAGGRASRMGGQQKALLEVDGRRIIDRQLDVLRPLFSEILLVANDPTGLEGLGLPIFPDEIRDQGPLRGILTALEAAISSHLVVVACDMPYLRADALTLLRDADREADVVVPVVGGRPEPLHARYGRRCVPEVQRRLAAGDLKIARFFEAVRTIRIEEAALREIDPTLKFLGNLNTPW